MKCRRRSLASVGPHLESLENRCLLSAVVGPVFNTPLQDAYWVTDTPAAAAYLNNPLTTLQLMPKAIAGGLQFKGSPAWTGTSFSLTVTTGDALGASVSGNNVSVTVVDGSTTWSDVVTELNSNLDFQTLNLVAGLAGNDGNATAVDTTALTPWGSGLKLTAGSGAGSITMTIVGGATGDSPNVTISGVNITVAITPGVTTWQNVVDALNADTDTAYTALKMTASVAGPDAQTVQGSALASLISQVTYNPTPVLAWTASQVGAAGNNVTVTIKDGTALDASVSGNDIVITIDTGTTTLQNIIDKLNGMPGFVALNVPVSVVGSGSALASALALTHLAGGSDMAPGSRTIGIDGYESGNVPLTIQVTTDRPDVLNIDVPDGTIDANGTIHESDPFAKLHFVDSTGKSMGDIYAQIFLNDPASAAIAQRFIDLSTKGVKSTAASLFLRPDLHKADGLQFTAVVKGPDANKVTITIAGGTALNVAVSGTDVLITINSGVTRLQDIYTALAQNQDFLGLYVAVQVKGTNVLAAASSESHLSGGTGDLIGGTPFYSHVVVHRVIPNFMIQTGDKLGGDGSGYTGLGDVPDAYYLRLTYGGEGVFGSANAGSGTSDGQFFITQDSYTYGNGQYMIFGQMISGSDLLNTIINLPTGQNAAHSGVSDYPNNPPYLQSVTMFQSAQDGSFIVTPTSDFTGVAHVTVTLTDASGHTKSKTILITTQDEMGSAPTITTVDSQTLTPGSNKTIPVTATDDKGMEIKYAISNVTDARMKPYVSIDSQTGQVTIDTPSTYHGVFSVTVTATEMGIDGTGPWTGSGVLPYTSSGFAERSPGQMSFRVYSLDTTEQWGQTGDNANAVAVLNHTLYEALGSYGLKIYDITDPSNPTLLGAYQKLDSSGNPAQDTNGHALQQYRDVKVQQQVVGGVIKTIVYETNQQGGVDVLDATDPANVTLLSNFDGGTAAENTSAGDYRPYCIATVLHNNYAIVPGMNQVTLYNISDPAHPGDAISVTLPYGLSFYATANAVFNGNTMYVADLAGTVFMFNMSNMTRPAFVNYFKTGGEPWGMDVQNNRLYVADLVKGMLVYDISNAHNAVKVGQYKPSNTCYDVVVKNQQAFLFTADSTIALQVNNLAKITVDNTYNCVGSASPILDGANLIMPAGSGFSTKDQSSLLTHRLVAPGMPTTFLDESGHSVTVSAVGVRVDISLGGVAQGQIEKIDILPIVAGGSVTITVAGGVHTDANDVVVEGSLGLGSFNAGALDLDGDFTVGTAATDKAIGAITLGNVLAGHALTVNGTGTGFTFKAGVVQDFVINSAHTRITSLTVGSWTDSTYLDPTPDINTVAVGKITSSGDFGADMELTGYSNITKLVLGPVSINGYLQGATWDIGGAVGTITATKGATDSRVTSTGSMGLLTLGSAQAADFMAGISGVTDADRHAAAASQFNPLVSIKGVVIKGFSSMTPGQILLSDSNFSAATIGASTLLNVQTSNSSDFGLFVLLNKAKTQLNSVRIGQLNQYGETAAYQRLLNNSTIWSSRLATGDYNDSQLVLSSLHP